MTEDVIQSASPVPDQHLVRGWRSVMFAPVGSGQRRRRGSDGVRLAAALLTAEETGNRINHARHHALPAAVSA